MQEISKICYELVCKDFQLENTAENQLITMDELTKWLSQHLQYLLNKDMNSLLNFLYRIDISENKVKEILHLSNPENISLELAELIIQREKQKAETRLKYRTI